MEEKRQQPKGFHTVQVAVRTTLWKEGIKQNLEVVGETLPFSRDEDLVDNAIESIKRALETYLRNLGALPYEVRIKLNKREDEGQAPFPEA